MSVIGPRPGLWNQDILTAERDKYNANDTSVLLFTQFAMVFVESRRSFVLKTFDCCFRGSAFVYLPLMMEATSVGVAILLRKRSLGLGAFRIVTSLVLEA